MDIISKVTLNEGMSNYEHKAKDDQVSIYQAFAASTIGASYRSDFLFPGDESNNINIHRSIRSQDKIIGTIITSVGGAMLMTLVKGPMLELYWTKGRTNSDDVNNGVDLSHSLKGAVMITIEMFSWSCFMVLQAITLKSYPAELSLTAWICLLELLSEQ
nr:WAT1-related protein At2g37460-like [Tanacetum cinerariifolium]